MIWIRGGWWSPGISGDRAKLSAAKLSAAKLSAKLEVER